jgi:tRNA(Ile)-lysidine synthase
MSSLSDRVLQLIEKERLVPEWGRVLVALSGGSDSVALTFLLRSLGSSARFTIAGVVHLNHQLRQAADDDEKFCRELAKRLSLRFEVGRSDVRGKAKAEGISIEEAGHRARHAFFDCALSKMNADCVATAHTRDDQAETYLMRLIRGAGPEGLSGIWPKAGNIIRPLLDVTKTELREYLVSQGIVFCEDETNFDTTITRNRVRHELIPLLRNRFSPSIVDVLARDATISRGDAEWLGSVANERSVAIVENNQRGLVVNAVALAVEPVAVARRIAKQVLEKASSKTVGFEDVERFLKIVREPKRDQGVDFFNCRVERDGDCVIIKKPKPRVVALKSEGGFSYQLAVPGEVHVPEAGLVISAVHASADNPVSEVLSARGNTVAVSAGPLSDQLVVRSWKPGDIVRPLGLNGRKKLQDFFVDRKVTRSARQTVPIVTDTQKRIVWIVGHTVSEDFRVSAGVTGMLILKARTLQAC